MFDIKWIRDNPEAFDAGLKKRGIAPGGDVKFARELIEIDEVRRAVLTRLQEAQARRNAASKEGGKARAANDETKAQALAAEVAALKDELQKGEDQQLIIGRAMIDALSVIPNLPREDVPVGKDEHGNKEVRKVGSPPKIVGVNKPLQHFGLLGDHFAYDANGGCLAADMFGPGFCDIQRDGVGYIGCGH